MIKKFKVTSPSSLTATNAEVPGLIRGPNFGATGNVVFVSDFGLYARFFVVSDCLTICNLPFDFQESI